MNLEHAFVVTGSAFLSLSNSPTEGRISIHQNESSSTNNPKAYSVEDIRQQHVAAYRPWTTEEERRLKIVFFEGTSIQDISASLGRNQGAITSRLIKLGIPYTK